jgi:hypothetical protein
MIRTALLLLLLALTPAAADQASQLPTFNQSISITTGNTYQAISSTTQAMRALTIQNTNTTTDNCFIEVSGLVTAGMTTSTAVTIAGKPASTAGKVSILLGPGQSYGRYYPHIPTGPIVGTCATAGDTMYVDWQ